jgi:hypothetical protein
MILLQAYQHTMADHNRLDSEPDQPPPRSQIDWGFFFQWLLATTVGWAIGWGLVGDISIGVVIGIGQWLVLRRFMFEPGWWVWASSIGWGVGWAVIVVVEIIPADAGIAGSGVIGLIFGLLLGTAQWLVLRQHVYGAGWWVLASTVGWAIAFTGLLGQTVIGVVAGIVTGLAMDLLLRFPR